MRTTDELIAELLRRRGIEDAERFFNPTLADFPSPDSLPGVKDAAEEILAALAAGRQVVVFGDYDCDGICATAILVRTLRALGSSVAPFLPERLTEGYGMSERSVARMLREHPSVGLVVTVDNGINSVEQVAALKSRGVGVVVTDHHLAGDTLPGCTVVNPKVDAPPELAGLCGAGVAFVLANELIKVAKARGVYDGPNIGGPLLVLAGLATVTDIMPLLGVNRDLVAEALRRFRTWAPIGLQELVLKAAKSCPTAMTTRDFGFLIGPRINAAGRMSDGREALELVLCDEQDREMARELARKVDLHNVTRKSVEQTMTEEALKKIVDGAPAQLIVLPEGHQGVAGIVAARILEKLGGRTPVCVLAGGHGSARAPEGFNIRDAFEACRAHLTTYGGHAAAGGFSVKEGEVDAFRASLCEYAAAHIGSVGGVSADDSVAELVAEPGELTLGFAQAIARMEPFGEQNPEPVFGLRGICLHDVRPLGKDGSHLILQADRFKAIWWNHGDLVEELRGESAAPHDIDFTIETSEYRGEITLELRIRALRRTNP